jgi:hypothetical protein
MPPESRRELTEEERGRMEAEMAVALGRYDEERKEVERRFEAAYRSALERVVPVSSEPPEIEKGQIWLNRGGRERFEVIKGGQSPWLVMLSDPTPRRERLFEASYMRRNMTLERPPARPVVEASGEREAMEAAKEDWKRRQLSGTDPLLAGSSFEAGWNARAASTRVPGEAGARAVIEGLLRVIRGGVSESDKVTDVAAATSWLAASRVPSAPGPGVPYVGKIDREEFDAALADPEVKALHADAAKAFGAPELVERATSLAERYGEAIISIRAALGVSHLNDRGRITRARCVIAGLDEEDCTVLDAVSGPPESDERP